MHFFFRSDWVDPEDRIEDAVSGAQKPEARAPLRRAQGRLRYAGVRYQCFLMNTTTSKLASSSSAATKYRPEDSDPVLVFNAPIM